MVAGQLLRVVRIEVAFVPVFEVCIGAVADVEVFEGLADSA